MATPTTRALVLFAAAALAGPPLAASLAGRAGRARADDAAAARSWAERGERLAAEGRHQDAVEAWKRARDAAPDDPAQTTGLARAYARLGQARLEAGDASGALADLGVAASLAPGQASHRAALAEAARAADEPGLARSEAQAALAAAPEHAGALELLGLLEYDEGRLAEAEVLLRRALAADGKRAVARAVYDRVRRERAIEATHAVVLSAHFRIQHPPDAAGGAAAERVSKALETAYGEVGAALGYYPRGLVTVLLYREEEFRAVTSAHGWVAALYDGKIRIPLADDLLAAPEALSLVARHEYVHALIAARTRRCPVWLHEGLAQRFEGKRADERALARAAAAGDLAPFRELARGFTGIADRGRVDLVYAQSLSFTSFLVDLRGPSEMAAVLDELGRGRTLDEALGRSFGEGLEALEARWQAGLGARSGGR